MALTGVLLSGTAAVVVLRTANWIHPKVQTVRLLHLLLYFPAVHTRLHYLCVPEPVAAAVPESGAVPEQGRQPVVADSLGRQGTAQ
jgi:hypothetical protein